MLGNVINSNAAAAGQALLIRGATISGLKQARWFGMGSHVSDNDPEVIEKYKERTLKGKTVSHFPDDAPGWEEQLASDSEAIVKAERASSKSMNDMREETIHCLMEEADNLVTGSGEGDQSSASGRC